MVLLDTAHVLDTGGFNLSCRGNESLAWRRLGTVGIANPNRRLELSPSSLTPTGGTPQTILTRAHRRFRPAAANAAVSFRVLSGPNGGRTGQDITDSQGYARFTYSSDAQGGDVIQASAANASGASLESNQVTVTWSSLS